MTYRREEGSIRSLWAKIQAIHYSRMTGIEVEKAFLEEASPLQTDDLRKSLISRARLGDSANISRPNLHAPPSQWMESAEISPQTTRPLPRLRVDSLGFRVGSPCFPFRLFYTFVLSLSFGPAPTRIARVFIHVDRDANRDDPISLSLHLSTPLKTNTWRGVE